MIQQYALAAKNPDDLLGGAKIPNTARLRDFVSDKALAVGPSDEFSPIKPAANILPLIALFLNLAAFEQIPAARKSRPTWRSSGFIPFELRGFWIFVACSVRECSDLAPIVQWRLGL
jgi:hypothetical protein